MPVYSRCIAALSSNPKPLQNAPNANIYLNFFVSYWWGNMLCRLWLRASGCPLDLSTLIQRYQSSTGKCTFLLWVHRQETLWCFSSHSTRASVPEAVYGHAVDAILREACMLPCDVCGTCRKKRNENLLLFPHIVFRSLLHFCFLSFCWEVSHCSMSSSWVIIMLSLKGFCLCVCVSGKWLKKEI